MPPCGSCHWGSLCLSGRLHKTSGAWPCFSSSVCTHTLVPIPQFRKGVGWKKALLVHLAVWAIHSIKQQQNLALTFGPARPAQLRSGWSKWLSACRRMPSRCLWKLFWRFYLHIGCMSASVWTLQGCVSRKVNVWSHFVTSFSNESNCLSFQAEMSVYKKDVFFCVWL